MFAAAAQTPALRQLIPLERKALDWQEVSQAKSGTVVVKDGSFSGASDARIKAYLIEPAPGRPRKAAILFVHWLEPESPDSNRTEFLEQAKQLAAEGAVCLLVETMWSDPEWFSKRDPEQDYDQSLRQARDLRRALDFLVRQPELAGKPIAYVGHDFGMMYGILLGGVDARPQVWALQAGTSRFADWYLLGRAQLTEAEKQGVRDRLAPLDPIAWIDNLEGAVLLQFGTNDKFVKNTVADELAAKVNQDQVDLQVKTYDAGHGLNAQAVADRMEWLRDQLGLVEE